MNIPQTGLPWTTSIEGKEYASILNDVLNRPIVAWFSCNKRCVHQLYKVTARLGDNEWMVMGHNFDEELEVMVMLSGTELHKALRYLTEKNGWTMCEFTTGLDFHQAVLRYLNN